MQEENGEVRQEEIHKRCMTVKMSAGVSGYDFVGEELN